jgi:hypothetical protein
MIKRYAPNRRERLVHVAQRGLAALMLSLGAVLLAATTATATPRVTGVTFTGDVASPTVTLVGTGFGQSPPKGTSDANTTCGSYGVGNGDVYGTNGLWFLDDTNGWSAGFSNAKAANCIGIVIDSWTVTQVVFHFGVAYDSFDSWFAASGDNYVIDVKGWYWGGVVSYAG